MTGNTTSSTRRHSPYSNILTATGGRFFHPCCISKMEERLDVFCSYKASLRIKNSIEGRMAKSRHTMHNNTKQIMKAALT